MKEIVYHEYGSADVLKLKDVGPTNNCELNENQSAIGNRQYLSAVAHSAGLNRFVSEILGLAPRLYAAARFAGW